MIVTVADGGDPSLSDTAVVEVHVTRNLNAPTCDAKQPVTINYTQPLGVTFGSITATDLDLTVSIKLCG